MIRRIFTSLKPSFLIRHYVFGLCFTTLYVCILFKRYTFAQNSFEIIMGLSMVTLSLLLFPFATLIYEEIRDTMIGNSVYIINNAFIILFVKLFIKSIIFSFSIPIGILGILYILFRTRNTNSTE